MAVPDPPGRANVLAATIHPPPNVNRAEAECSHRQQPCVYALGCVDHPLQRGNGRRLSALSSLSSPHLLAASALRARGASQAAQPDSSATGSAPMPGAAWRGVCGSEHSTDDVLAQRVQPEAAYRGDCPGMARCVPNVTSGKRRITLRYRDTARLESPVGARRRSLRHTSPLLCQHAPPPPGYG
jgi:hypothetical protein